MKMLFSPNLLALLLIHWPRITHPRLKSPTAANPSAAWPPKASRDTFGLPVHEGPGRALLPRPHVQRVVERGQAIAGGLSSRCISCPMSCGVASFFACPGRRTPGSRRRSAAGVRSRPVHR